MSPDASAVLADRKEALERLFPGHTLAFEPLVADGFHVGWYLVLDHKRVPGLVVRVFDGRIWTRKHIVSCVQEELERRQLALV